MDLMIAGMMKHRIEKYKVIVKDLLAGKTLSDEQTEFLKKEKVI